MKIALIGSNGLLGTEIKKLGMDIIYLTREDLDISNSENTFKTLAKINPDIVINAAAVTDNRVIEKNPTTAISSNIIGAANVAIACLFLECRYIYISTDYIYKGDKGNYKETDEILPFNLYSWTKLGGECSAKAVKNHLIIRTSFGGKTFYPQAFVDKWSSKDYVDVIAPMIMEAATSPLTGILNLGTGRKTLYDYAYTHNQDVTPIRLADTNFFTPYDTSMNLQKWMDYQSENPVARPHSSCRVCGSDKLVKYLDLELMPLANNLEYTSIRAKEKERFPLQVMFCESCSLSQLSVVIDPEKMFSNYVYRSSVNAPYVKHCRAMAKDLMKNYFSSLDNLESIFHIDIAGNDGALLKEFNDELFDSLDHKPLNVDPASNLAAISEAIGIPTIADFWSLDLAKHIVAKYGNAHLITATNVFAHVDNVREFIEAANTCLMEEGLLVIECPYLVDFIENNEFDTIYFEHLSYMSVIPMKQLCSDLGMKIIDVKKQAIHGGTIRVIIAKESSGWHVRESVEHFIMGEISAGFNTIQAYKNWSGKVHGMISQFGSELLRLKKSGYKIAGFAASAKGNTLLNSAGINTDLVDYIIDSTPEKIGKFSPGTGIPIKHPQELQKNQPDYLILLSWNFSETLIEKAKELGFKGKFIIPIPEFTVIDAV